MRRSSAVGGFTLVELLVVIAIIAILAGVILANLNSGSAQSRDAKRQGDVRGMENALELYRLKYGRYPEGCNGPNAWSGQSDSTYACSSGGPYVNGLAPEFISALPNDQVLNGTNSGYVYTVDTDGAVYKFMALNTVEFDTVTLQHEFARCGQSSRSRYNVYDECSISPNNPSGGGVYTYNQTGTNPNSWNGNSCDAPNMNNDYAVSAGYANGGMYNGTYLRSEQAREYFTDRIRCK